MGKKVELSVVGVLHRISPSKVAEVSEAIEELGPLELEIRRDSGNRFDGNAIAVYLSEKPYHNIHLGYLSREVAAEYAPRMDKGTLKIEEAWLIELDPSEGVGQLLLKLG